MEIYQFILLVLGMVIGIAVLIYKLTKKAPQFRVIERRAGSVVVYSPQIKMDGVWFNLIRENYTFPIISVYDREEFLLDKDAITVITDFKTEGNFSVPSNQKLRPNQKQITVD